MDDEEIEVPQPGNKGPMLAVAGFVLGIGAGFGGATFMAPPVESSEVAAAEPADARAVMALEPFTVNLRGGDGRMLMLEVQLELLEAEMEAVGGRTPLLRDAVVFLASDYAAAELEGLDGKLRLRDELLGRLNAALDQPAVKRIYFTHFLVQ